MGWPARRGLPGHGGFGVDSGWRGGARAIESIEIEEMEMRKIVLLSMFGILTCGLPAAHAAFYVDKSGEATPTVAANDSAPLSAAESGKARVIHVGTIPTDIAPAKGMGEDMPLSLAVQQVMPDGWVVYFDGAEGRDRQVSWTGSDVWIKSLDRLLSRVDGTAQVDWARKVVTIKVPVIKEEVLPPTTAPVVAGAASDTAVAVAERVWQVRYTDGNVQGALRRWAEESGEGWQISWESPMEFPTVLEASFTGDFRAAVDGVVSALAASEAPVWARYYNNKVVRIVPAGTKTE